MARRRKSTKKSAKGIGYVRAKMRAWSKAHGKARAKKNSRRGATAGAMDTIRGGHEGRLHRRRLRTDAEYHRKAVEEALMAQELLLADLLSKSPKSSVYRRSDEKKSVHKKKGVRRIVRKNRRRY